MTDRIKGFTVTLERDMREDDVEQLMAAMRYMKGVAHVEPSISSVDDHINQQRIKREMKSKFYKFIDENF